MIGTISNALFGCYARRRAVRIDRLSLAQTQRDTLLRLVQVARDTRFGRDHDFKSIRTIADYRRRVPIRDYEAFWSDYWQPPFPVLDNVTWPGRVPYLALSSGTTSGATKHIPVSRAMLASNQKAALTSLAWFHAAHPDVPLWNGRLFFLGGSTELRSLAGGRVLAGDLSGIVARETPSLARPFVFPPRDIALLSDWDHKLTQLVEQSIKLPISMISGVPSWLLVLFDRIKQVTGKRHVADVWPMLRLVIHGGTSFAPYRSLFRDVIGNDAVRFLETYPASEGFVAAEDPRYGQLRLVPDHDVFYEFVPVDELGQSNSTRHSAFEVVLGVQYAVVVTTCAGLWSYALGDTVCFTSVDPPLLRFTGRTKQFLSAFGEHLIAEEIDRAVATAAERTGSNVVDFHVGPIFPPDDATPGRHRFLVEFAGAHASLGRFVEILDETLARSNEDYAAHRAGDLTMQAPEIVMVRPGGFARWMRSKGKLGGQHKLPRIDAIGSLSNEIHDWLVTHGELVHPTQRRKLEMPV